jgi:hypothetical protein
VVRNPADAGVSGSSRRRSEMQFHGFDLEHAWRVAFWVILILAAVVSAAHAILG